MCANDSVMSRAFYSFFSLVALEDINSTSQIIQCDEIGTKWKYWKCWRHCKNNPSNISILEAPTDLNFFCLMRFPAFVLAIACASSFISAGLVPGFRPPSVPLIVFSPSSSIWSPFDSLTDGWPTHWTGTVMALQGLIRIDGNSFCFMGDCKSQKFAVLKQTSVQVFPLETVYTFDGNGVSLVVNFTTPAIPDDIKMLSLPLTYISFTVYATDGQAHSVQVYYDNTAELVVNSVDEYVTWAEVSGLPDDTIALKCEFCRALFFISFDCFVLFFVFLFVEESIKSEFFLVLFFSNQFFFFSRFSFHVFQNSNFWLCSGKCPTTHLWGLWGFSANQLGIPVHCTRWQSHRVQLHNCPIQHNPR
jgi:hypothetical protein